MPFISRCCCGDPHCCVNLCAGFTPDDTIGVVISLPGLDGDFGLVEELNLTSSDYGWHDLLPDDSDELPETISDAGDLAGLNIAIGAIECGNIDERCVWVNLYEEDSSFFPAGIYPENPDYPVNPTLLDSCSLYGFSSTITYGADDVSYLWHEGEADETEVFLDASLTISIHIVYARSPAGNRFLAVTVGIIDSHTEIEEIMVGDVLTPVPILKFSDRNYYGAIPLSGALACNGYETSIGIAPNDIEYIHGSDLETAYPYCNLSQYFKDNRSEERRVGKECRL